MRSSAYGCRWTAFPIALCLTFMAGFTYGAEPSVISTSTTEPDALSQHSVIRGAFRHELTQEREFNRMTPFVVLVNIVNTDTKKFERQFGGSTHAGWGPTKKVRGAEVLPGHYEAYVSCLYNGYPMSLWQTFFQQIDAQPGYEYVLECVGHMGNNGNPHPVVHVKALQSLAAGVTPLSTDCISLSDVPLLGRIGVKKCKSDLNSSL